MDLRLSHEGKSFETQAKVVFSQSGMGMGLVFTKYRPEDSVILHKWIAGLSGESTPEMHTLEQDAQIPAKQDLKEEQLYVLNELVVTLMKKGVLTEEEGQTLLRRLLRHDQML